MFLWMVKSEAPGAQLTCDQMDLPRDPHCTVCKYRKHRRSVSTHCVLSCDYLPFIVPSCEDVNRMAVSARD